MKKCRSISVLLFAILLFVSAEVSAQDWLRIEVDNFVKKDSAQGVTSGDILFLGSSSIRMWNNIESYFPGHPVINRGFGGSSMRHAIYYFDELVRPHNPSQIMLYFGDNDLADPNNGYDVDLFIKDVECFVSMVRIILPGTPICFISIKPSPSRRVYFDRYIEANKRLQDMCRENPSLRYIDVWTPMVDKNNRLKDPGTFLQDSLHMTPKGYNVWRDQITPYLIK